jgi:hypothetical protein
MVSQVLQVQRAQQVKTVSQVKQAQRAKMVRQVQRGQQGKTASKAQRARMVRMVSMAKRVRQVLKAPRGIEDRRDLICERVPEISPRCLICLKVQESIMLCCGESVTRLNCLLTVFEARSESMPC